MESHLTEEALWANNVAGRLRLLQASCANDDPKQRQSFLAEELDRALQPIAPSRRDAHLCAIEDFFPAWGGQPAVANHDLPQGHTAEQLVDQLMESAAALNETERAMLAERLRPAGLVVKESRAVSPSASPDLQKSFAIADGKSLDVERVQKLLLGLSGVFLALDQLVWTLWRQLNSKTAYRKEGEFAKLAGVYLTGDPEVSTEQIRQPLERTRRLIAALMGAMGRSGANFAQRHSADVAPETIEKAARIEKKTFESLEAASWRKYRELYKEYSTEQTLESQIQQEFVKSAEELLRGIGK
jgi:hypothetical protein